MKCQLIFMCNWAWFLQWFSWFFGHLEQASLQVCVQCFTQYLPCMSHLNLVLTQFTIFRWFFYHNCAHFSLGTGKKKFLKIWIPFFLQVMIVVRWLMLDTGKLYHQKISCLRGRRLMEQSFGETPSISSAASRIIELIWFMCMTSTVSHWTFVFSGKDHLKKSYPQEVDLNIELLNFEVELSGNKYKNTWNESFASWSVV